MPVEKLDHAPQGANTISAQRLATFADRGCREGRLMKALDDPKNVRRLAYLLWKNAK